MKCRSVISYVCVCVYAYMFAHTYMGSMYGQYVHTLWAVCTHLYTYAHTCKHMYGQIYTQTHAIARARAHTHTLTLSHTHNHTHTLTQLRFDQVLLYARLFTIDDSEVGLRLLGCTV